MKHLRNLKNFKKNRVNVTNESVIMDASGDYKVNLLIDMSQSFINSYVKKVKDEQGKNIRTLLSDSTLAEELVKYVCNQYLNADTLPSNAIIGGGQSQAQGQGQEQGVQDIPQGQAQGQSQNQGQSQGQTQAQGQGQPQSQGQDIQVQVQTQSQPQSQGQGQGQGGQTQRSQGQFNDVEEDELPL